MKSFLKSLLMAFMGTGLFFSFLMMLTVPIMALFTRLGTNIERTSVVVSPAWFLRMIGVPSALVLFIVLFAVGLHRYRRDNHQQVQAVRN